MSQCLTKPQGAPKSQKFACLLIRLYNLSTGNGVPDQAPSREPPFGALEEGGPPDTPEQNSDTASEGGTPGAPSLNRNPDPMKSFQTRDEGLGRAPRGLLQADEMARYPLFCRTLILISL